MSASSPARVRLTDRLGPGGQERERPFVIGVLADLGGDRPFPGSGFRPIDQATFEDVLRRIGPRLTVSTHDGDRLVNLDLAFSSLTDFDADGLQKQVPDTLVSAVLSNPDFLRLESAWRGLHYLVREAGPNEAQEIRVLDVRRNDLARDLTADGAGQLFEEAAGGGGLGSDPCGLLIADDEFDVRRADAVELLHGLAAVGASIHAPVIAATAPASFGLTSWANLAELRTPHKLFEPVTYAGWKSFREAPESRFVALTLPRALARPGAGDAADADERSVTCWMSAAWAYAAVAARAFRESGWFARTHGPEDGAVPGLPPPHVYLGAPPLTDGTVDANDQELARLGFLPLAQGADAPRPEKAAFGSASSCHQPPTYNDPIVTARAATAARLDVLLCAGRFVQALTGLAAMQSLSKAGLAQRLNEWLAGFTAADGSADKPLGLATVELKDGPGGTCVARLRLRLDFQFADPAELTVGVPVTVRG